MRDDSAVRGGTAVTATDATVAEMGVRDGQLVSRAGRVRRLARRGTLDRG